MGSVKILPNWGGGMLTSVVATVGGAGRAWPGLTFFAQHSEQNTICRPAQISNIVHFALIWDTANDKEYSNVTEKEHSQKMILLIAWPHNKNSLETWPHFSNNGLIIKHE